MRRLVLVLALLVGACASPVSPTPDLTGTWAENFSFPGASLVLTLDASGNGRGTYAIEAGRSGVLQVTGTVVRSTVTLVIQYDYGPVRTFTGSLTDANHLVGTFDDNPGTLTFTRVVQLFGAARRSWRILNSSVSDGPCLYSPSGTHADGVARCESGSVLTHC
jgi:hypothetical protein